MNISAIVVGFNEAPFLKNCLQSISFCEEILYFDLGSTDNSVAVAETAGASIHHHERVLSCEWIHSKFAHTTKHEWLLIIDPDEVADPSLVEEITRLFESGGPADNIGAIRVPWHFYFKNQPLKGTPWGGKNQRIFIVHNKRFIFTPEIHVGRNPVPGFGILDIEGHDNNCIHHYWMQDCKTLYEKHRRYLNNEGEARYNNGARASLLKILYTPFRQFYFSFITKKGYKNYVLGFFLSLFWAWYQTTAVIRVFKFQQKAAALQKKRYN